MLAVAGWSAATFSKKTTVARATCASRNWTAGKCRVWSWETDVARRIKGVLGNAAQRELLPDGEVVGTCRPTAKVQMY